MAVLPMAIHSLTVVFFLRGRGISPVQTKPLLTPFTLNPASQPPQTLAPSRTFLVLLSASALGQAHFPYPVDTLTYLSPYKPSYRVSVPLVSYLLPFSAIFLKV